MGGKARKLDGAMVGQVEYVGRVAWIGDNCGDKNESTRLPTEKEGKLFQFWSFKYNELFRQSFAASVENMYFKLHTMYMISRIMEK